MTTHTNKEQNTESKPTGLLKLMKEYPPVAWFLVIITCMGALWGGLKFLDNRIEEKVNDTAFLSALAEHIQPVMIVDEKNSVLFDRGASRVIEVHVKRVEPNFEIIVTPQEHLATAPLIFPLDDYGTFEIEQGQGFSWIYRFTVDSGVPWPEGEEKSRFLVEVMHNKPL